MTMDFVDRMMATIPRSKPSIEKIQRTRVLAHRGAHDEKCTENTFEAFDRALELGVWGIEFDIRWTKDNEPVIHHDRDCLRTFRDAHVLEDHPFEVLRRKFAKVPTLREVIERYGKKIHLMVELKRSEIAWSPKRIERVAKEFADLESVTDYHLMSLDADLLLRCDFARRESLLPVAEFNAESLSEMVLREKMAGITGHYMLLNDKQVRRHVDAGQHVGTGFVTSKSVLYREINRGVDWIYTNFPEMTLSLLKT
jgi:glycerophosphoryl diester phosphodiesterase